jgi:hypothetical protein
MYGKPNTVVSDAETGIVGQLVQQNLAAMGVKFHQVPVRHHHSSLAEQACHRIRETTARLSLSPTAGDWSDVLSAAMFALNFTPLSVSSVVPVAAFFGYAPTAPDTLAQELQQQLRSLNTVLHQL